MAKIPRPAKLDIKDIQKKIRHFNRKRFQKAKFPRPTKLDFKNIHQLCKEKGKQDTKEKVPKARPITWKAKCSNNLLAFRGKQMLMKPSQIGLQKLNVKTMY